MPTLHDWLAQLPLEPFGKITGAGFTSLSRAELSSTAPVVSRLATPYLTIDSTAVRANIAALHTWADERGYLVAPHGKTTMAPQLWSRQLDAGAWGITVATLAQLHTAVAFGVPRIMLANPIATAAAARQIRSMIETAAARSVYSWVDSEEAVIALADPHGSELPVLLEVGREGGRTGVRSIADARAVLARIRDTPGVRLAGTAAYEGAIGASPSRSEVSEFVAYVLELHRGLVAPLVGPQALVSIGGSYRLGEVDLGLSRLSPTDGRVVIRSGVSVVHDDGHYEQAQQEAPPAAPRFTPALRMVASVIAVHDEVAIVDAGRRDTGQDMGMPRALELWRDGSVLDTAATPMALTKLFDQHGYVPVKAFDAVPAVGDHIMIGVSHPCTTFDKWRDIVELNGPLHPESRAVGMIRTFF